MKELNLPIKFDLVTIGQALHWFDFEKTMAYVKDTLMAENGTFAVLSYITDVFRFRSRTSLSTLKRLNKKRRLNSKKQKK